MLNLLAALLVFCGGLEAAHAEQPPYASGRLIVKLTPQAHAKVHKVLKRTGSVSWKKLPVPALKQLSQRYRISRWRPLFPPSQTEDAVGLSRIYVLTCDPATDIPRAAAAFAAVKESVEYAEPDYLAHIQPGPPQQ